jgi:energy-coupling factor transporter ATP-binding protein EcfA2
MVQPSPDTLSTMRLLAEQVRVRGEGAFVPITAKTGTGKTTLCENLTVFMPTDFRSTVSLSEAEVTYDKLIELASDASAGGVANESRILPLLIDNRESAPPSGTELAAIKRYLREATFGRRSVILWPETALATAESMSTGYIEMAGNPSVQIPVRIEGPPQATWQQIAIHTIQMASNISDLSGVGVSPNDFDPAESPSLGEFLRRVGDSYAALQTQIRESTARVLRLAIVFVSMSSGSGVLPQLTNPNQSGLLDGAALISATPNSVIGRSWASRRGLLTRIIVQFDARAFGLPPQASVPILRRHGESDVVDVLTNASVRSDRTRMLTALKRSDFGRYLSGTAQATFENRGTPASASLSAFRAVGALGFTGARDKALNKALLEGIKEYFEDQTIAATHVVAETGLSFAPLTPDNAFEIDGYQHCVEYAWSTLQALDGGRAAAAEYILQKLENYARELGQLGA